MLSEDELLSTSQLHSDILCERFRCNNGVLSSGGSAIIFCSSWNNNDVAIKLWNHASSEGLAELRNEIFMYENIRRNQPSFLGSILPEPVLSWGKRNYNSLYSDKALLVYSYLPVKLFCDDNGQLWISKGPGVHCEVVSEMSQRNIRHQINEAVKKIQLIDFVHNEVSFANIRVYQNLHCSETESLHVCLIDLGQVLISNSKIFMISTYGQK